MTQVSKTGTIYTPNVGPHAGVAAAFVWGATPIAYGIGGRGYACAAAYIDSGGIVKITIAVGDTRNGNDPIFPGVAAADYDATNDPGGYIPYDPNATTLSNIADGCWAFFSQFTS